MTVEPIVINDAVPKKLQEEIKQQLKYQAMWYFCPSAAGVGNNINIADDKIDDSPQMVHGLVNENEHSGPLGVLAFTLCNYFERQLDIEIKHVIRVKANLLMKDEGAQKKYHPPHIDVPDKDCISIVYYVEDSDGETVVFDKTVDEDPIDLNIVDTIEPKQGRIAVFPSRVFHASKKPTENDTRTIINFILQTDRAKIVDMFGI